MAKKKKRSIEDICFPVPQNFSLTTPTNSEGEIGSNEAGKKYLLQQTLQTAYKISVPYNFTSTYSREKPHQLVTEEQIETVVSLFQALQPRDAIEAALAQQFIVVHLQAMQSVKTGMGELDLKKLGLTHQILETLQKYRNKGAQQISVQYVHQGQIVNDQVVNVKTGHDNDGMESVTIEG